MPRTNKICTLSTAAQNGFKNPPLNSETRPGSGIPDLGTPKQLVSGTELDFGPRWDLDLGTPNAGLDFGTPKKAGLGNRAEFGNTLVTWICEL